MQIESDHPFRVEAMRTAGSTADRQPGAVILIELKAQFYKLVTLQPERVCAHQLVKWSIGVVKQIFAK